MSNKILGSAFEHRLARLLYDEGWWVYNTINKASGQPMDIIACKNNIPVLIDAKVCSNDSFDLVRIEDNQILSGKYFEKCGNNHVYFAFEFKDKSIYFMDFDLLIAMRENDTKKMKKEDIITFSVSLKDWLDKWKQE